MLWEGTFSDGANAYRRLLKFFLGQQWANWRCTTSQDQARHHTQPLVERPATEKYPTGTPIDTEAHAHTHGGERTAQRHTDGSIVTHVGQLCGRSPGTVRLSRAPSAIAPARHNALSRVYVQQRGKRCCVDPQGKALPY